jgi:predicted small secreted protein
MKKALLSLLLVAFGLSLLGCGETVSGIGKDACRVGRGVKMIFIREEGK